MEDGTRGIGALARDSGLTISALRFYDTAGVLRPARVDPVTGYRWYADEQVGQARLIASLRRVGMPLTDISRVLAARRDPIAVGHLLDQHLQQLEGGLADARRHLEVARDLLDRQEKALTTLTVHGADLVSALTAVRFAVSDDPELPGLNGVLFDYDGGTLRLVATDRYRLAVASVQATDRNGPAVRVIAPMPWINRIAPRPDQQICLRLAPDALSIDDANTAAIDAGFPDYQRVLRTTPERQVTVSSADLVHRLSTGPTRTLNQAPNNSAHEVSVVLLTEDTLEVIEENQPDAAAFNREFLLEAIDAGDAEQLVLALDGPIGPLAIRVPGRPNDINLLMPTRLN